MTAVTDRIASLLAPAEGIEPSFSVLETDALPLHHAGKVYLF